MNNLPIILTRFKDYLFSQPQTPSKITVKNYISDISHFIRWFETKTGRTFSPNSINFEFIQAYRNESAESLSASSMERHVSSLRKFFKFLKDEDIIQVNIFEQQKTESAEALAKKDPFSLKDFKNFLFEDKSSHLTIKNYIIDVKQFIAWAKQVLNTSTSEEILATLNTELINEYKKRLTQEVGFSPATVNRKLSSLRRYLAWANQEGITVSRDYSVENISKAKQPLNIPETLSHKPLAISHKGYSAFPPLRLAQKLARAGSLTFDAILTAPLASFASKGIEALWKLRGQPVFKKSEATVAIKNITPRDLLGIKNISKKLYAPFAVSTKQMSLIQKLIFHARYTRPKWYIRYHSYAIAHYFNFAVLIIFLAVVGFGLYNAFFAKPQSQPTFAALPTAPPRILSFQGRLTDINDNPITSSTLIRYAIYNDITASGSALLWQEVDRANPDTDGIFNNILGNVTSIPSTLFSENAALYLGVTIESTDELTPRQQLATVAYAANSETLQGLPPSTAAGAGTSDVVLALDSSGNLTIGGSANPTFTASGGTFKLSGQPLLLTTNTGTGSNVQVVPDGLGKIDLQKPLVNNSNSGNISTVPGSVQINDEFSVLATSSGRSAFTINQDSTGPIISASASGIAQFTIDNSGNETLAGDSTLQGTTGLTLSGADSDLTFTATGNHDISASGGTLRLGALTLTGAVTGNNQSVTGLNNLSAGGTITFSGFNANNNVLYATVSTGVLTGANTNTAGQCLLSGASAPSWSSCPAGTPSNELYWNQTDGALYPNNSTVDLLIGGQSTTSAKFAVLNVNSGTTTATVSGNLVVYPNAGTGGNLTVGTASPTDRVTIAGGGLAFTDDGKGVNFYGGIYLIKAIGGNLQTNGTFQGTTLNGTTGINTGGSGGTQRIDSSGNLLNIGTITASSTITFSTFTSNGGPLYTNGSGQLAQVTAGTTTQCLLGGTTPSFGSCATGQSLDFFWNQTNGALYPNNSTVDLLIGGQATTSAKFAFTGLSNLSNQTQASISGQLIIMPNNGYSGKVGIGTTTPSQLLDVANGQVVVSGSLTTTGSNVGIISVTSTITNSNDAASVRLRNTFNGAGNIPAGIDVAPTFAPSSSIALARGGLLAAFFAPPSSVTITDAIAGDFANVYSAVSGAVTNGTTARIGSPVALGSLKPTTQYGVLVNNQGLSGTTTSYGLYIDSQSGSSTNYSAIFAGGNVGIGDSSPASLFTVGDGDDFQINSTGAITAATGITSSGTITFSAFTSNGGPLYTNGSGVLAQTTAGTSSQCLLGGTSPAFGYCGTGVTTDEFWNQTSGALYTNNSTVDFLFGAQATSSATFRLIGAGGKFQGTNPVASISAHTSFAALVVDNDKTGDLITASNSGVARFVVKGQGNVGIGHSNPISQLYVTRPLLAGATGKALAIFDQIENQDIIAASKSGITQFRIDSSGNTYSSQYYDINDSTYFLDPAGGTSLITSGVFQIAGSTAVAYNRIGTATAGGANVGASNDLLVSDALEVDGLIYADGGIDTTFTAGSVVFAGTSGVLAEDNSNIFYNDSSNLFGLGTATPISVLHATRPLSVQVTGKALAIFDQLENQDLLTASSSGTTKFKIENGGSVDIFSSATDDSIFRVAANSTANYIQSGSALTSGSAKDLYFSSIFGATVWAQIKSDGLFVIGNISTDGDIATTAEELYVEGDIETNANLRVDGTGGITVAGAATTGLNFTNTGVTTDINLQNGETIDNNTNGFIKFTGKAIFDNNGGTVDAVTAGASDVHIGSQIASAGTAGEVSRLTLQPYGWLDGPFHLVARDTASSAFIDWRYDATNLLTIEYNGNVGIGDTSPAALFTVGNGDDFQVSSTGNISSNATGTAFTLSGAATTAISISNTGVTTDINLQNGETIDNNTNGTISFTATTGAFSGALTVDGGAIFNATVDSATDVDISYNRSSSACASCWVLAVENTNTNANQNVMLIQAGVADSTANTWFVAFRDSDEVNQGNIEGCAGNCTFFETSSDARLKKDIVNTHFTIDDLMKIKVRDFTWISDESRVTGFIAQELYEAYEFAVSPGTNGDDFKSNPWGIDYGRITPLIVKGVQDQQLQIEGQKTKMVNIEADLAISNSGNLSIIEQNPDQFIVKESGRNITRIAGLAEAFIGNIRSGIINTRNIVVTGSANIGSITTSSLNVTADSVTIAGQSLRNYIARVVNETITQQQLISPIASSEQISTNLLNPLAKNPDAKIAIKLNDNKGESKLEIQNASGSAVASIDSSGNISANNATLSGTLRAQRIIADQIEGLNIQTATLSANYVTNNYYTASQAATSEPFPTLSASSSGTSNYELASSNYINIATFSSQLAYVDNLNSQTAVFSQGLTTYGITTLSDTSIVGQLAINGTLILAENSINILGSDLNLQPLRQGGISIMAGLIYIDPNGDAKFGSDVTVEGTLYANNIGIKNSELRIQNETDEVLKVDSLGNLVASGAGTFSKLNLSIAQQALAAGNEVLATGSAGTITLKANKSEITVKNTLVTENSLIYVTPVSQTLGQSLYLLRQLPQESFTVGISVPVPIDVKFNFLIIN